jgi:predicted porin
LSASTLVHAQSSLALYGILDAGARSDRNTADPAASSPNSLTAFGSGILNTSRFGFKGSEDLGDGLKANFNLEGGISGATGASSNASSLFDRRAIVGLQGAWGRLDLGRNTTFGYDITAAYVTDPLGQELGNNKQGTSYKAWTINPLSTVYGSGFTTVRRDNVLKYLGTFGDVSVGAAYALGGVSGHSSANSSWQALVRYNSNGVNLAGTYDDLTDSTGTKHLKTYNLGGNYSFSGVKVTAGYTDQQADAGFVPSAGALTGYTVANPYAFVGAGATATGVKLAVTDLGLTYHFTPALNVVGAFYQTKLSANGVSSSQFNTYVVRARYALSKSTDLYAELDQSHSNGVAPTSAAGQATSYTGLAAGLQVRF